MPTDYVTREYELKPKQRELLLAAVSRRAPTSVRLSHGALTSVSEDGGEGIGLPLTSHQVKRIERNVRKSMGVELRLSKAQLNAIRRGGGAGKLLGIAKDAAHKAARTARSAAKAVAPAAKPIGEAALKVGTKVAEDAVKRLVERAARRVGSGKKKAAARTR